MENVDKITNYAALEKIAKSTSKVLLVTLRSEEYPSLMCQVISSAVDDYHNKARCININGKAARIIQKELNILSLPVLAVFRHGKITSIFQGLVALHELEQLLAKFD